MWVERDSRSKQHGGRRLLAFSHSKTCFKNIRSLLYQVGRVSRCQEILFAFFLKLHSFSICIIFDAFTLF